jgi:hypothetical protein
MTDAIEDAIGRILAKLAAVRRGGYASFGSEKHRFKLNPPLAEATIAAVEKQHTVQLPNDYRLFLAAAGNGGAGPYYGIFRSSSGTESHPRTIRALWRSPRPCGRAWRRVPR